jgi:hypothetical protein
MKEDELIVVKVEFQFESRECNISSGSSNGNSVPCSSLLAAAGIP